MLGEGIKDTVGAVTDGVVVTGDGALLALRIVVGAVMGRGHGHHLRSHMVVVHLVMGRGYRGGLHRGLHRRSY